uniref:Uncharacterized protein n=1 Tax=Rhizophora mucronata TaxID=61149 RepID=A0A2P2Q120_RHIMU
MSKKVISIQSRIERQTICYIK